MNRWNDMIEDGQIVRVPLAMMDSVQRAIAREATATPARPRTVQEWREYYDAQRRAQAARSDSYDRYAERIRNAWRTAR